MIYKGNQDEYFELENVDANNYRSYRTTMPGTLQLMWFTTDGNKLTIDGVPYVFDTNQLITLSPYHRVEYEVVNGMKLLRFNREFYCVLNHDSEVGCKGLLYYAAAKIPLITIAGMELEILETAWKLAGLEFEMKDELQQEMLQMMLKRILIKSKGLWLASMMINMSFSGSLLSW
jgi:AraC family transcriptional regulator, transcriptional activator of pobA